MDAIIQCLFCQHQHQILCNFVGPSSQCEKRTYTEGPTFGSLCCYLNVKISNAWCRQFKDLSQFNNQCSDGDSEIVTTTCAQMLCLECFELVDKLSKLYAGLEKIKHEIVTMTKGIRRVIIRKKNGWEADVGTQAQVTRKRGRPKKGEANRRELEFIQEFQKLVRESGDINTTVLSGHSINEHQVSRDTVICGPTKNLEDENWKCIENPLEPKETRENVTVYPKEEPFEDAEVKTEVDSENLNDEDTMSDDTFAVSELIGGHENSYVSSSSRDTTMDDKSHQSTNKETNKCSKDTIRRTIRVNKIAISTPRRRHKKVASTSCDPIRLPPLKLKLKLKRSVQSADNCKSVSGRLLTCRYCHIKFSSPHKYYIHRKSHLPLHSKSLDIGTVYGLENGRKRVVARICSICGHKVNGHQLAIFMEHMLSHENLADASPTVHSCDKCDKQFSIKLNLDLHRICNHEWNHVILKCDTCGDVTCKTQTEFVVHLKSHESVTRTYSCKSCPMACTSLDKLLVHMVKHSKSKRLYCSECPSFVSTTLKELYQHSKDVHPEIKEKFSCTHCEKSFLMPATLRQHLKVTHGIGEEDDELGEYFCSQCTTGKVYKSKRSLEKHLRFYHGDDDSRPHKCDQCDKSFIYKSLLQKHVQEKHERIRYPCPHCPKSYSEQIQLGHHMKVHTGEGLFTCATCGKQFPRQGQLKVHSVVHLEKSAESCCVCEICGKEFGNELHLRKHKSSHKEKKLECPHCQMMFRRPDHLRSHLRIHTGERPFVCPVCAKGFNRRDILIVHMKIHGMNQEEAGKCYKQHLESMKQENT